MTLSLADFQGQPLVIAFYPAVRSPVGGDQMALYNEVLPGFRRHPANIVLGVRGGVNGTPTFFVTAARLSA